QEKAQNIFDYVRTAQNYYSPFSFWEDQKYYLQVGVEKADLKNLFTKVCAEFRIPIANLGGWCDINARGSFMRRFAEWERKGKPCVLLYWGDPDPGGLHISSFLKSNFADLENAVGWSPKNLIIDRFGLNHDFIEQNSLVWIDNLKTGNPKQPPLDDPRH